MSVQAMVSCCCVTDTLQRVPLLGGQRELQLGEGSALSGFGFGFGSGDGRARGPVA